MEAHDAVERFEKVAEGHERSQDEGGELARYAAIVVAVMAAFLAIATFQGNAADRDVITGETKAADADALFQANDVKSIVASANSTVLGVIGKGNPKESVAVAKAQALEARINSEFIPVERRLTGTIRTAEHQRHRAENLHFVYALSEVALQIAIVLAGISILIRRRWLLTSGGLLGLAGIILLLIGLTY